jgi:hypothetical protein
MHFPSKQVGVLPLHVSISTQVVASSLHLCT